MIDTIGIPSDIFALSVVWFVLSSQVWRSWLGLTLLLVLRMILVWVFWFACKARRNRLLGAGGMQAGLKQASNRFRYMCWMHPKRVPQVW